MQSLSRVLPRASCSPICTSCLRHLHTSRTALNRALPSQSPRPALSLLQTRIQATSPSNRAQQRTYTEKTSADDLIKEITKQYATTRDEFEIATEETEKKSVYAADDRKAAREELDSLNEMYEEALEGEDGEEVQRRVGQRIRELDEAIKALEEKALGD